MGSGQTIQSSLVSPHNVFRGYAAISALVGFALLLWSASGLGGNSAVGSFGEASVVQVVGSICLAAACCAVGLATVSDAQSQHRGLFWFALGHAVVLLVILTRVFLVSGPGSGDYVVGALGAVTMLLLYLWAAARRQFSRRFVSRTKTSDGTASTPLEHLHSQYERNIREAGAQEKRNRLACDLHDSIKQQILAIQMAAATAQTRFEGGPSGARAALDQIRSLAREAMTEMEVLLDQLRAARLENNGFGGSPEKTL